MALTPLEKIIADAMYDYDEKLTKEVAVAILAARPDFAMLLEGKAKIITVELYNFIMDHLQKDNRYVSFSVW